MLQCFLSFCRVTAKNVAVNATAPLHFAWPVNAKCGRKWEDIMLGRWLLTMAVVLVALWPNPGAAQSWPSKPVKIVAPFAPGGSSDTLARIIADHLSKRFNRQFFVENRGGGGGVIGSQAVATAEPDGHTLGMTSIGSHVIAPSTNPKAGYDPVRNFTHISYLGGPPIVMLVHPSVPARTFAEFRAVAKANQPYSYMSPGPGTLGQLLAELWGQREGIKLSHIAYRGSGQAIGDVVAGHVKMGSITWIAALGAMRGKTVVPLAVSSASRMAEFKAVPTFKEIGLPELTASTWFGLGGPAKIPADIVGAVNKAVEEILNLADVRKRLDAQGVELVRMSPVEMTKFVASENAKWGPIARGVAKGAK
jgi:tripartite-type tricarboxylate transporter receptor subunit TctC